MVNHKILSDFYSSDKIRCNLQNSFVVGAGNNFSVNTTGGFASSGVMTSTGANQPLYYALAYIMKT